MTKLIVLKEMNLRKSSQQTIIDRTNTDLKLLKEAQNNKSEYALLPSGEWASIRIDKDNIESQITALEEINTKAQLRLIRYTKDIKSYSEIGKLSKETKDIFIKSFTKKTEHVQNYVNSLTDLIHGMVQAKKNKQVNKDGQYYVDGHYVATSYYSEFMKKERVTLKEEKERLKRYKQYLSFAKKIKTT